MSDAFNPYQSPGAPLAAAVTTANAPRRRFRARVIPAAFSLIVGSLIVCGSCLALYWLLSEQWPARGKLLDQVYGRGQAEEIHRRFVFARRARDAAGPTCALVGGLFVATAAGPYMKARWRKAVTLSALGIAIMSVSYPVELFAHWLVTNYL